MNMLVWVVLGVLILIALIAVAFAVKRQRRTADYRSFFIMGIIWLPAGMILLLLEKTSSTGSLFLLLGLAYLVIGLANRKKWGKQEEITPATRKRRMILTIVVTVLLVLGLIAFALY